MHRAVHLAFAAAVLASAVSAFAQEQASVPRTITIDELSPGMRGYGLTVVKGSSAERFDIEIIDVLRGIAPGRNGVIVRASGLGLEQSGIIAGMSGSPIYVNDRLVGALSFGWAWPKEPIGGVTPIGEMEQALEAPLPQPAPASSWESLDIFRIIDPSRPLGPFLRAGEERGATPAGLQPLALPLVMPFLSPQARRVAETFFPSGRFVLAEGAAAGQPPDNAAPVTFQPGSSVFAALVTGDMTMGATGTITDVRGSSVYGLGHPFLNYDGVAIPMYTSRVAGIFPSLFRSFKLAYPLQEIGAITRDRATGIMGVMGQKSRTVPMTVTVDNAGAVRKFDYRVFDHYSMTPQLAAVVAAASVTALGDLPAETTLSYGLAVSYAGGRAIDFKWQTGGKDAVVSMAKDVQALFEITMLNPLEKLDPQSIDITARVDSGNRSALIEAVAVRQNEVRPGDVLEVSVRLKPALSAPVTLTIGLPIPKNALPGQKSLVVCDGRTSDVLDVQENPHLLTPTDVDQLFRVITPRRSAGEVVARLADVDQGVAIGSEEYPNLPSSALAILAAPQTSALSPLYKSVSASAATPYVVVGKSVIPVRIVNRTER